MKKTTMIAALVGMQVVLGVYSASAGVAAVVPEPSSALLLSTGSAAVALYVWWRGRK